MFYFILVILLISIFVFIGIKIYKSVLDKKNERLRKICANNTNPYILPSKKLYTSRCICDIQCTKTSEQANQDAMEMHMYSHIQSNL